MNKSIMLLGFAALFAYSAQAAKITSLKVDGNTVIFTQSENKPAGSPGCAASLPTSWGLQLLTDADRATYAALVAAAGSNMDIVVTSAQSCINDGAIEQVKSVEVLPVIAAAVPKGMKIVAIGNYLSTGGSYAYILYSDMAPSGNPYMVKKWNGPDWYVQCQESHPFTTAMGTKVTTICLAS